MQRTKRRTIGLLLGMAAATTLSTPVAAADTPAVTELNTFVVAGGKPRGVIEGQTWSTYAMVRDASGKRVGDASLACGVEKTREKRVLADCAHTLRIDGKGTLLMHGTHHYKDQTVMPGTADPMRLMILGGTGAYAGASGPADVTEIVGGYSYRFGPTG